jgi:hypothetical protein
MNWRRFPFTLILLILWAGLRMSGIKMSAGDVSGIVFILASISVLIIEFCKSADIGMKTFKIEQAVSVFVTVVATIALTRLVSFGDIHIGDIFLAIVVVCDAWVSPVTSFGMALRNIQGNVGHEANSEGQ